MKIVDFLPVSLIEPELQSRDRTGVLKELIRLLTREYDGLDAGGMLRILEERERLGSTGIGQGVAIPHGKMEGLRKVLLAAGRTAGGVDFDSADGQPVHLFFLILAPHNSVGVHLSLLAKISKIAGDTGTNAALMDAKDASDIRGVIDGADEE